ncbi:hypothetical protein ACHAXS_001059 [Conticribra weissflogii]
MNNGCIKLVDADDASITVSWPALSSSSSTKYNLQYRPSTSSTDNGIDSGGALLYTSLATDLTNTQARKRNLTGAGHGFWFRVSVATKSKTRIDKNAMEYVTHNRPFQVLTMMEQSQRMEAPMVRIDSTVVSPTPNSYVAHVSWKPYDNPSLLLGYKLQMRENDGGTSWTTVAPCLSGTEVKKKNLTSKNGYTFRVRPVLRGETDTSESNLETSVSEGGNSVPFSSPTVVIGQKKSKKSSSDSGNSGLMKLFSGLPKDCLYAKGGTKSVPISEALADFDFVFLYASAGWCGPCKRYTPELIKFYNTCRNLYSQAPNTTKSVEIVFLSADHDLNGFKLYYAGMPWLAVPYDCDLREKLMAHIKVTGVPRLTVLDGKTGKILESNSVGRALDLARFTKMLK